jgi:hypothetical protein
MADKGVNEWSHGSELFENLESSIISRGTLGQSKPLLSVRVIPEQLTGLLVTEENLHCIISLFSENSEVFAGCESILRGQR